MQLVDGVDVVEVLDHEPERILHPHRWPDGQRRPGGVVDDAATPRGVERGGLVDIVGGSHPQRESGARRYEP